MANASFNHTRSRSWGLVIAIALLLSAAHSIAAIAGTLDSKYTFAIEPQAMSSALLAFSEQADIQVATASADLRNLKSPGARGERTARSALSALLAGTDLRFQEIAENAVAIEALTTHDARTSHDTGHQAVSAQTRLAQTQVAAEDEGNVPSDGEGQTRERQKSDESMGIPEVLVTGSKVLNMDIRRSRDDPQPYVIFDRETIGRSGAADLSDFLKQRLTMNTTNILGSQGNSATGNRSTINLRGLGSSHTVILVDGHRVASTNFAGTPMQPDINGIPLSAIERIEVLPATAGGIYGGNATGGIVNIILRRDYQGVETKLTYQNSFDSGGAQRRVEVNAGFAMEGGKTNVLIAGSYADANALLVQDRDLLQRGRSAIFAREPASFLPPNATPAGATTNIRSTTVSGGVVQPLVLDNGTALNSTFASVPGGYAGVSSDLGVGLAANAGRYNLDVGNGDGSRQGGRFSLLSEPEIESLQVTVRREFTPSLQVFLDAAAANNVTRQPDGDIANFTLAADAPGNPFQQNVSVSVPVTQGSLSEAIYHDRRITAGIIFKLPARWAAEADYTWNRVRFSTEVTPILSSAGVAAVNNGTLDVFRDIGAFPLDFSPFLEPARGVGPIHSTLKDAVLRFSGPVGSLPGGDPVVSLQVEKRDELFDEGFLDSQTFIPSRSQSVNSFYLEGRVPLVSDRNALPGIQELELQAAVRRDDYTVHGVTSFVSSSSPVPIVRTESSDSSTNPTIGLRWRATPDVMLRASFGTGYLPPTVNQILANPSTSPLPVIDPRRGGESVTLPAGSVLLGGSPDLQPEESENYSAGIVLTPRFAPGWRLSMDYNRVKFDQRISDFPGGRQAMVDNETLFPDRILRGTPSASDIEQGWAGPIVLLDLTLLNISRARLEAYDMQLDYALQTANLGDFEFFALATWQTHLQTQALAGEAMIENVGFGSSNPLKFKANAGFTWNRRNWTLGWMATYFDSYLVYSATAADATVNRLIAQQGNEGRIPSQIYHDVFATYRFGTDTSLRSWTSDLLSRTELQLGVRNLFNERPAFDARNTDNYYSFFGDPRRANYWLSVKTSF